MLSFCVIIGKLKISRYLVGWEWYNDFLSVTIWMGMGQHDLASNDLDRNGTANFDGNVVYGEVELTADVSFAW